MMSFIRHTREQSGIRLDEKLRWFHDDEEVTNANIIEAFNRGVRVTPDGKFTLNVGNDWCFIEVADCAFSVLAVDKSDTEQLSIRLSDRTAESLDVSTVSIGVDGAFRCLVKSGKAKAKFSRSAQVQLGEFINDVDGKFVLHSGEHVVILKS